MRAESLKYSQLAMVDIDLFQFQQHAIQRHTASHPTLQTDQNAIDSCSLSEYSTICKSVIINYNSNAREDIIFFSYFGLPFQSFSNFIAYILAGCWKDHMTRAMSKVIEYNVDNNSVEKCVAICKQKSKIFWFNVCFISKF